MHRGQLGIKPSLGIITFDFAHLKTEQVVESLLKEEGIGEITIFALPFKERKERKIIFSHRPDQSKAMYTLDLAKKYDLNFVRWDGYQEIKRCDYYLVAGAGLIPSESIQGKKIINAHPGIIPSVRGLDAFKWAIYEGIELGVTLHFIDGDVDCGEIISIEKTPVYTDDNIKTLAKRHYDLEVAMISNFMRFLEKKSKISMPQRDVHMRMPAQIEKEMLDKFSSYKERYAKAFSV